MTEGGVNTWLEHWVARQGRGKLPLMLTDPPTNPGMTDIHKVSSNKGKKRIEWVDPDDDGDDDGEVDADKVSNGGESTEQPQKSPLPAGTDSKPFVGGPPHTLGLCRDAQSPPQVSQNAI